MTLETREDIAGAKVAELVEFYNANVAEEDQVTKFKNRAEAEEAVIAIFDSREAVGAKIGAAVAKTWEDDEVREARTKRWTCIVDGEEYQSVRAAFDALGLPMAKHVKFRRQLVLAPKQKLEFEGHKFSLKPYEKKVPEQAEAA